MITLPQHKTPEIPGSLFCCPICGNLLTCEIDEWSQNDDDSWGVSEAGLHLSCASEPELSDDPMKYADWFEGHYQHPYIDWMPLEHRVLAWMNANYRFEMSTP